MESPVGEMILKALAAEGMKQWELANALHISNSCVSRIISGEERIKDERAFAIERRLPGFDSRAALKGQIDSKYEQSMKRYNRSVK